MEQTRFVDKFFEGPQPLSDICNDFFICLENEHLHCKDVSTFYSVYLLIIAGPEGTSFTLVPSRSSWVAPPSASPVALNMWSCRVKLDEEKSQYAGLAQQMVLAQQMYSFCGGW